MRSPISRVLRLLHAAGAFALAWTARRAFCHCAGYFTASSLSSWTPERDALREEAFTPRSREGAGRVAFAGELGALPDEDSFFTQD